MLDADGAPRYVLPQAEIDAYADGRCPHQRRTDSEPGGEDPLAGEGVID